MRNTIPLMAAGVFVTAVVVLLYASQVDSEARYGNPHAGIACSECHTVTAASEAVPDQMDFSRRCRGCHLAGLSRQSDEPLNFHQSTDRECGECHSFHRIDRLSARGREFAFAYGNRRLRSQCSACHSSREHLEGLSQGHREAALLFHSDFKYLGTLSVSEGCLICHSQNPAFMATPDGFSMTGAIPGFDPHGSHPVGVRVLPGQGEPGNRIRHRIDPRLRLADDRIECTTCHSLSSSSPNRLAGFVDRNELCRGCHVLD